jgi:hypothetical protein
MSHTARHAHRKTIVNATDFFHLGWVEIATVTPEPMRNPSTVTP